MGSRHFFETLPSTQDRAIELARSGALIGTRVVASRQSQGRGRFEHAWASPPGGLYLSIVLPDLPAAPTLFPLAMGVGLVDRFQLRYGVRARLKWPNDLVILRPRAPPQKLAGILVDRVGVMEGVYRLVAGFGINVATCRDEMPAELRDSVAFLSELTDQRPTLRDVEEEVVAAALATARALEDSGGRLGILRGAEALLYGPGHQAIVDGVALGTIRGLAEDGSLRVATKDRELLVQTGDLLVLENA